MKSYFNTGVVSVEDKYEVGILKYSKVWFENGLLSEENYYYDYKRDALNVIEGKDTLQYSTGGYIGNMKHFNHNGIIIFETHILPNRKEQKITRDSIGNVVKMDTISY